MVCRMDLQEIGRVIRQTRKRRGLTQNQLAASARVSRYTVIKLESGSAGDIQFKTLVSITSVLCLEVTVVDLPVSGLRVLGEP